MPTSQWRRWKIFLRMIPVNWCRCWRNDKRACKNQDESFWRFFLKDCWSCWNSLYNRPVLYSEIQWYIFHVCWAMWKKCSKSTEVNSNRVSPFSWCSCVQTAWRYVSPIQLISNVLTFLFVPVFFLKRAQIAVADVWACFEGKGVAEFSDIDSITIFADYRCSHLYLPLLWIPARFYFVLHDIGFLRC